MKRRALFLVVGCLATFTPLLPAITPGSVEPAFRSGLNRLGRVQSLVRQPNGRVIIAGKFESVQGRLSSGIARLLPDGRLDTSFNPGLGLSGAAHQVALQPDGKILIAGDFDRCHLTSVQHLVRLLPNGAVDPTFVCVPSDEVNVVLPLPDGRILIAGRFSNINGTARGRIARLNPNGSLDTSFNPPSGVTSGFVSAVAVSGDKYYLVGAFTTYNGISRQGIARIETDGALDASFNPGTGASSIQDIAIDPESRPVIVGGFTTYNGSSSPGIARLNVNGTRDTTFAIGAGIPSFVLRIRILPSGTHLIAGSFPTVDGTPTRRAARLRPDGSLDPSFNLGPDVDGEIDDILPSGSSLLLGGDFKLTASPRSTMCAQVTSRGRPSSAFNPAVSGEASVVDHIAAQPGGKALICGNFSSYAGAPRRNIARIFANGRLDTSFDPRGGPDGRVFDSITLADGRIIVAGSFTTFDGVPRQKIARLLPNGRLDTTFDPGTGPNNNIQALALSPTGEIYVGGTFTTWGAFSRGRFARLLPNGSLDTTFFPPGVNGPLSPYVSSLAVNPTSGAITLGGNFATYNGTSRPNLARALPSGSLDSSFITGSGPDAAVLDLLLTDSFGSVLIAGDFSAYNGTTRKHIALVSSTGSLSTTFDPGTGFDASVYKIDRQLNDRIVAVGEFDSFSSNPQPGIVRLTLDGEIDSTFDVGDGPFEPTAYAVAALPSGRLLVGGEFASFDFQPQACLVSLLGSLEASNARFSGALQPLTGTEVAGSFSLSLASGNVFTAVLRQNKLTTTFRGAFDFEGQWTGFFRRPDGIEVAANLLLSRSGTGYGESLIFGNLISPEGGGQIVAFQPLVPTGGRLVPGLTGYYTAALIPASTGDPALPEGSGLLTLTQGSSGPARLAGTTADGRPFTASTTMGSGGLLVLHANLTGGAGGYLNGNFFVAFSNPLRPLVSTSLVWHRRPGPQPYAAGFTQSMNCEGSLYLRPNSIFLDFANTPNNARLTLDLGSLPALSTRILSIDPANRVTPNPAGTIADLSVTVNPRTGLIGGSFLPPGNTRRATLRGIATTFPKIGRGHSLFPGPADTPPIRSSRLTLSIP